MSAKGRNKRRLPGRAQTRAQGWVDSHEREVLRNTGNRDNRRAQPRLGAFAVKRAVLTTTENGLFDRADIVDFLTGDHGALMMNNVGVSLITPAEGRNLVDPWDDSFDSIRQSLEEACRQLPDTLRGSIGRAGIFGSGRQQRGRRFVGYTLDPNMSQVLSAERNTLFEAIGQRRRHSHTPHISLLETRDYHVAGALKNQLYGFRRIKIPVELGQPVIIPVSIKDDSAHLPG